jgi:hypothetical protein
VGGGRSGELDDHAGRIEVGVRKPDRVDDPFASSVAWPKVDEEDLVDIMVNELAKFVGEDCFFGIGQLAFENAQLEVIPRVSHGSKDFAESFWIADIVGDDVGIAHGSLGGKFAKSYIETSAPSIRVNQIVREHGNSVIQGSRIKIVFLILFLNISRGEKPC